MSDEDLLQALLDTVLGRQCESVNFFIMGNQWLVSVKRPGTSTYAVGVDPSPRRALGKALNPTALEAVTANGHGMTFEGMELI